jgi:hypothetical protein
MKLTLIIAAVMLIACFRTGARYSNENTNPYKVYKLDSINNYYLIYASRKDSLYKIVSKKEPSKNCNQIRKDGEYQFKLHSSIAHRRIGGKEILPQNSLLVNCFYYDESTSICLEGDSIRDLHYADNIKGLCFKE